MTLQDIFEKTTAKWMEGSGPMSDIVISSRIRLARNLAQEPYPHMLKAEQAQEVLDKVKKAVDDPKLQKKMGGLLFINLADLSPLERQILVERHLMSPQHAENGSPKGVIIREDEAISILVNEEDHIRIQCLFPGLQLEEAWELASTVDDALEEKLDFAFSENRGYLTACPTNVGTGMRASVMMHLPALVMTNQAGRVFAALSQFGITVRGLYGEGTEATGNLFQISNQITLGRAEEEIVANLVAVVREVADQERMARHMLMRETKEQLEDRVGRAYGILSNARILSSQDAMGLLSDLRLGIDLGLINNIEAKVLNELIILIQPGWLQKLNGKEISPFERDVRRAALIRERLLQKK